MMDHATVFVTPITELLVQITPNSSALVEIIQQIISVYSDVKQVHKHLILVLLLTLLFSLNAINSFNVYPVTYSI